jgi:hypothetical protein
VRSSWRRSARRPNRTRVPLSVRCDSLAQAWSLLLVSRCSGGATTWPRLARLAHTSGAVVVSTAPQALNHLVPQRGNVLQHPFLPLARRVFQLLHGALGAILQISIR